MVLYDWNNVSGIMCPSFNISKINSTTFQCPINLTHLCNETINVEFETWTLDKKFLKNGPFGRVFLNCSSLIEEIIPEKNSQKGGLSEAIFSILEGAASILSEVQKFLETSVWLFQMRVTKPPKMHPLLKSFFWQIPHLSLLSTYSYLFTNLFVKGWFTWMYLDRMDWLDVMYHNMWW